MKSVLAIYHSESMGIEYGLPNDICVSTYYLTGASQRLTRQTVLPQFDSMIVQLSPEISDRKLRLIDSTIAGVKPQTLFIEMLKKNNITGEWAERLFAHRLPALNKYIGNGLTETVCTLPICRRSFMLIGVRTGERFRLFANPVYDKPSYWNTVDMCVHPLAPTGLKWVYPSTADAEDNILCPEQSAFLAQSGLSGREVLQSVEAGYPIPISVTSYAYANQQICLRAHTKSLLLRDGNSTYLVNARGWLRLFGFDDDFDFPRTSGEYEVYLDPYRGRFRVGQELLKPAGVKRLRQCYPPKLARQLILPLL
jgi:hypothetical protein